jgi:hypothetical protein
MNPRLLPCSLEGAPSIADEETLSKAIVAYAPLTPDERKTMLLKVKQAARNDSALELNADQQKKLDAEIAALNK